jgi:hypothetical protein
MDNLIEKINHFLLEKKENKYDKFFRKKMKEWNISSPDELSKEEKKKFFDEVDREWKSEEEKKNENINESGPISKEGALKYVFKLPKEGEFTAEFLDGTKTTIEVEPDEKSSGKYAFIGKDKGHVFQSWSEKPSKDEAAKVLRRVKFHGSKE